MKPRHKFPLRIALVLAAFLGLGTHGASAQTASQVYAQGVQAYSQGDVERAKQKLQLTLEIDRNFRPASALLSRIALEEQQASGGVSRATVSVRGLESIVVPVEFKETSLQSALEYIRQRVASASGGKNQVNFVLNLPPGLANKRVTLQLEHVPVTELLRYLGKLAGVSFQIQKYAIMVTPAATGSASPTEVPGSPAAVSPTP